MKSLLVVYKFSPFLLLLFLFIACYTNVEAQRHSFRAKERMNQVKLIKLLDVLDLDEKTSEKFIPRFNAIEKKFEDNRVQIDSALEELEISIQKGEKKERVNERIKVIMDLNKQFSALMNEKFEAIKPLLSEEQYAKYVLFEFKFSKEIHKMLIERRNRIDGNPHEGRPRRGAPGKDGAPPDRFE